MILKFFKESNRTETLSEFSIDIFSIFVREKQWKSVEKQHCFFLTNIENISIVNSSKLSVLLLSLKNFNIIQFIMIPRFSIYSILLFKPWLRCGFVARLTRVVILALGSREVQNRVSRSGCHCSSKQNRGNIIICFNRSYLFWCNTSKRIEEISQYISAYSTNSSASHFFRHFRGGGVFADCWEG